jgi:hypothetical protein
MGKRQTSAGLPKTGRAPRPLSIRFAGSGSDKKKPAGGGYHRQRTKAALAAAKLTPRCQQFVDIWLSGWEGDKLPSQQSLPTSQFKRLGTLTMCATIGPDPTRKIIYFGSDLPRIMRAKLLGVDWLALVSRGDRQEKLRHSASIADGTIYRTVRNVELATGGKHVFETVTVPYRPDSQGTVEVATFFDWNPPNKKAAMMGLNEIIRAPERAEFITIAKQQAAHPRCRLPPEHVKIVSRAAVRMVLSFTADMLNGAPSSRLDPLDYLIALAIGGANVAHIEDDTAVSKRYASDIEPAWMRRGISRAAIARATHIPLETVRRRVNKLIQSKILIERRDGLVLSPNDPFNLSARVDAMESTAALVEDMFQEIQAKGVRLGTLA